MPVAMSMVESLAEALRAEPEKDDAVKPAAEPRQRTATVNFISDGYVGVKEKRKYENVEGK
jgi:hypothetical protein